MKQVEVSLGERSYPILIEYGLLDRAGDALAPFAGAGRLIVVADEQVWAAQGARLQAAGLALEVLTVPAGEASKSWPELERLIVLEKERGGGHWLKLWRQVRGRRWGLVVDLRGSGLVRFLRTRKKAIYARPPSALDPVHKVVEAGRLLGVEGEPPAPYLFVSDERQAAADALLGEGGPILAMGPAANWSGKAWPAERFAVTASKLLDPGGPYADGRLLLLWGDED